MPPKMPPPNETRGRKIGRVFVKMGLITPQQLEATLLKQKKDPTPLGELLEIDGLPMGVQLTGPRGGDGHCPSQRSIAPGSARSNAAPSPASSGATSASWSKTWWVR